MATIRLKDRELTRKALPELCMCCGEESASCKQSQLVYFPDYLRYTAFIPLIYLLVHILVRKKRHVYIPLCREHAGHFAWRWWCRFLAGLTLFVLFVLLITVVCIIIETENLPDSTKLLTFFGTFISFLSWGLLCEGLHYLLKYTGIRASDISDRSITLAGVSPKFVRAIEAKRDEHREKDEPRFSDKFERVRWREREDRSDEE